MNRNGKGPCTVCVCTASMVFRVYNLVTALDKTCGDKSRKCLFCSCYHGKNWNRRQIKTRFPPSPYPKLFRIARQLYTLIFLPRQLWIGGGEGGYFFLFRRDGSRAQKLENRWSWNEQSTWGHRIMKVSVAFALWSKITSAVQKNLRSFERLETFHNYVILSIYS